MSNIYLFISNDSYLLNEEKEKYRVSLFVLGVIWWALTAFSRLTVGAHYLSDVCFSGIFTIIAYFIVVFVNTIISRRKKNIPSN